MMNLREALADADRGLAEAEARLVEVERQLAQYKDLLAERAQLTGLVAQLRDERRGLQMALARHEGQPVEPGPPEAEDWTDLTRAQAVTRALIEAGRPMAPAEIAEVLTARGRGDAPKAISVSLDRLQKRGRVRHGDRGQWMTTEEATLLE
jgi:hypothetical protein